MVIVDMACNNLFFLQSYTNRIKVLVMLILYKYMYIPTVLNYLHNLRHIARLVK